jgi:hypothetical protein
LVICFHGDPGGDVSEVDISKPPNAARRQDLRHIDSFNKYLLSASYVSGTEVGSGIQQ